MVAQEEPREVKNQRGIVGWFRTRVQLLRLGDLRVAAFMVPFALRLLPQLLEGLDVPIGYDTVAGYGSFARLVQKNGLPSQLVLLLEAHMAPLLWTLVGALAATGVSPLSLMVALPPFLYGCLGIALWRFCRQGLKWTPLASLFSVFAVLSYFLPLRYGWDAMKDVAGLTFLFLALAEIPRLASRDGRILFVIFATGSVLTEEVEAVLLGAIAGILFVQALRRRRFEATWLLTGVGCVALVLFYAGVWGVGGPGPFPPYGLPGPTPSGPPLIQGLVSYPSWTAKAIAATLIIAVGLAPLIYPAWRGRFQHPATDAWLLASSVGTFGIFLFPEGVFPIWPTWLFLMSFPLGLWATRGLLRMERRRLAVALVALIILSGSYLVLPAKSALPYFTSGETRWYIPTSMPQTIIPRDRIPGVVAAVSWLNSHAEAGDWIVVSDVFAGFVMIFGNASHLYPYHFVEQVDWKLFARARIIYTIYWADTSETWFAGGSPPQVFNPRFVQDGVALLDAPASALTA
jgi:hypothetical protein